MSSSVRVLGRLGRLALQAHSPGTATSALGAVMGGGSRVGVPQGPMRNMNINVFRRTFAEAAPAAKPPPPPSGNPSTFLRVLLLGSVAAGGVFAYALFSSEMPQQGPLGGGAPEPLSSAKKDYGAVKAAVIDMLDVEDYDDGSYGPILVRLAWHSSGTYCKADGTGGSGGATMRFSPECKHGANAGLAKAREILEPIKRRFPWISYGDLWTLAGCAALEGMGGPEIKWRPGRVDAADETACTPDGRLPDATKGAPHIRDVFGRMGFSDREIVALSGAHALGRCHTDRSGFSGPWTNAPTTFSNLYFTELMTTKWTKKKWAGPLQYEDPTGTLMMLPTDMSLIWDSKFKKVVKEYADNEELFFKDFAAAFGKLIELGVKFPATA
ncbi:hypothetical protein FOA52_005130 [Chlamydomonas sp. UWO 241]|nr:hypothetical protein FOA52_005130 [Chlamydomonas sp. UWO 241]